MKHPIRIIISAIILSALLFFIGIYTWGNLLELVLPVVGNVKYHETSLTGHYRDSMTLGLILALIPITTILIWKFAPVFTTSKRFFTVCIILLAMITSVLIRREMIKSQARNLQATAVLDYSDPANPQPKAIETGIPLSTLNFELFALYGLIGGSTISFFSLRQRSGGKNAQ
jgi:hypothetical protein